MPRVRISCAIVMILGSFVLILTVARLVLVERRLALLAADWEVAEIVLRKNVDINNNSEISSHKKNYYLRRLLENPND